MSPRRTSSDDPGREPDPAREVVVGLTRDIIMRATQAESTSLDEMLPVVYDEMRVLAAYFLRGERLARTLRPTALAHEAYLRLARSDFDARDTRHLLTVAATVMRRVLVDYARARKSAKRGLGAERVTLRDDLVDENGAPIDVLDLHQALETLGESHPRKVQVIELLYFSGLTIEEAAEVLEVNERTVRRDWQFAKAWLWEALTEEPDRRDG